MTDAEPATVLVLENVAKRVGKSTPLKNVNLTLKAGELVWIVGGAAGPKNHLSRLILGQTIADAGFVHRAGPPGPMLGALTGFNMSSSVLRGLEIRAAAYGIALGPYVDAMAGLMNNPEEMRRQFDKVNPVDKAILLYGSALLLPCTHYTNNSSPLPADRRARKALRPLYREARKRAGFIAMAKRPGAATRFAGQRLFRFNGGVLTETEIEEAEPA